MMSQRHQPHFEHHIREIRRTRRRFNLTLAAFFVVAAGVVGLQFSGIHAATVADCSIHTTIGGTIWKGTTPVAGAKLLFQNNQTGASSTLTTLSNGTWTVSVCKTTLFNLSVSSAAPAGYTGPVAVSYARFGMTDVPNYSTISNYPYQDSDFSCYHNSGANCSRASYYLYDLSVNYELDYDFRYNLAPTPVPTPTPHPTVTPAPTPRLTPTPMRTTSPRPSGSAGMTPPSVVADTTPPSIPGALQALVSGSNAVVSLSWTPSTDDTSGVSGYHLDRSVDQVNWDAMADSIVDTNYTDASVAFGVHYYYRLAATDTAGNVSGYATADIVTGAFANTTGGDGPVTYTSDDQLVSVEVPAGAIEGSADCSVEAAEAKVGTTDRPAIAGPYRLVCKTAGGDIIGNITKPVTWRYQLLDRLKGYSNPLAWQLASDGKLTKLGGAKLDRSKVLSFSMTSTDATVVLASVVKPLPINLIAAVLVVLMMVAGVFVVILRRRQQQRYNDYLRSKYYNI